jgi:thiamine biosynthesis protein ThiS
MISVNQVMLEWKTDYSIDDLLRDTKGNRQIFKVPGHGNIIIVNGEVLGSVQKKEYLIQNNDSITIIQAVGGG